jgi:hypothetical protein
MRGERELTEAGSHKSWAGDLTSGQASVSIAGVERLTVASFHFELLCGHSLAGLLTAAALLGTLLHHLVTFAHALASLSARAADVRANATGELVAF